MQGQAEQERFEKEKVLGAALSARGWRGFAEQSSDEKESRRKEDAIARTKERFKEEEKARAEKKASDNAAGAVFRRRPRSSPSSRGRGRAAVREQDACKH